MEINLSLNIDSATVLYVLLIYEGLWSKAFDDEGRSKLRDIKDAVYDGLISVPDFDWA